jgi:hypothetical protein
LPAQFPAFYPPLIRPLPFPPFPHHHPLPFLPPILAMSGCRPLRPISRCCGGLLVRGRKGEWGGRSSPSPIQKGLCLWMANSRAGWDRK